MAWHEIKNILEKFPKVQAEQIKLKEEVDRIEKERLQLENEVQIAENQKDTSLVVRLKKRVCELKGLHSRKMKEVAMKNNEVRELRNTQKRSTQMKHEIESLRHRQAAQARDYSKKDKARRLQIEKEKKRVTASQKKVYQLKKDKNKLMRSESAQNNKMKRKETCHCLTKKSVPIEKR